MCAHPRIYRGPYEDDVRGLREDEVVARRKENRLERDKARIQLGSSDKRYQVWHLRERLG